MPAARLFLIDTMALAFRSFFAFGRTSLATSQGIPTGAIYGTAMFLLKLLNEQRPEFLLAVTDSKELTFRHTMYPAYKATRDKMPDDLAAQLPAIFELIRVLPCQLVATPGVEADDVIATTAMRFAGPDLTAMIVSGDKDFLQLVNPSILLYAPKKNEEALVIDTAGVSERYGCTPAQIVDLLALMGDAVDNVPGVPGIGEKGAAKLLQTYGSLDGIYAHLDDIKAAKQQESLRIHRADAYLSRDLVTLNCDVPLPFTLEDLAVDPATSGNNPQLLEFCRKYELTSLVKRLSGTATSAAVTPKAARPKKVLPRSEPPAGESGASTVAPAAPLAPGADAASETRGPTVFGAVIHQVAVAADFDTMLSLLAGQKQIAIAAQPTGADVISDRLQTLALAIPGHVFVTSMTEEATYHLRPILGGQGHILVGHGLKLTMEYLHNNGITQYGPAFDLEIADYLLAPNNYDHSLATIATRHVPDLPAGHGTDIASLAALTLALYAPLNALIEAQDLGRVLHEVEMPLVPVLAAMEQAGVYVDPAFLMTYSDELDIAAKRLEQEIYAAAGQPFNVHSPKQLQEVLFDKLQLHKTIKRVKKTKTGLSTDESVLSQLSSHPVPRLILEFREVSKLKNTYVDPLAQFINPKTGRIHASFRQTVAATGRLSADRPNLQNIPMRTALGRRIRMAFRAQDPDSVLIAADYSQVELRLLASLSGDSALCEAFRQGEDVHRVTAAKIFGVPPAEVTPTLRSRAKAVNFGIIYGMGPQRLAQETGVSVAEAKAFISRYFEVYPGIRTYTETLIETARQTGYCTTIMGRRRPIPELREANKAVLARGENIAINAPLQGSAADLVKLAMIKTTAALRRERLPATLILQVHDELVLTARTDAAASVMELVKHCMETALPTNVPLEVDVHSGSTWLEAH